MTIRPASLEDANILLRWKNDKVMRKFAVVTHSRIKWEDHIEWLKYNIQTIQIILEGNKKIGMLRVTKDREVSINLDPKYRGMGYGSKIISEFCPKGVWAKIVNGNVASMRVFLANGFKIIDYQENFYVLQN